MEASFKLILHFTGHNSLKKLHYPQVEAYDSDPLIWHSGMKVRFAIAFGDALDRIKLLLPSIEWPFLVVHGDEDKVTYKGGSELLAKEAKSKDKEIKVVVSRFTILLISHLTEEIVEIFCDTNRIRYLYYDVFIYHKKVIGYEFLKDKNLPIDALK